MSNDFRRRERPHPVPLPKGEGDSARFAIEFLTHCVQRAQAMLAESPMRRVAQTNTNFQFSTGVCSTVR